MLTRHSQYSFTYGTCPVPELVGLAAEEGRGIALLTDINSTAGCIDFVRLAQEAGLQSVLGVDFRKDGRHFYTVLARNHSGYAAINRYLSAVESGQEQLTPRAPEWEDVYVIYPWAGEPKRPLAEHEYIGIAPGQLNRLRIAGASLPRSKLVANAPQTFRHKQDYNTHRLLRAIDQNTLLSKLDPSCHGRPEDRLHSPTEWESIYRDFPELVLRGRELLQNCEMSFEIKNYRKSQNQQVWTPGGTAADDRGKLRSLCREGLSYRYGSHPPQEVLERMERELAVLDARQFYSYFLINWDIVNYARSKGYYHVGRGSGANSLVAYLLRITDVDPIELDLYFERFMNLSRKQPPDFDVDFSWRDRQDVTRYIFERYPKAALLGAHTTFQFRAVVRELGKVMGLPARDIEEMVRPRARKDGLDDLQKLVLRYGKHIQNMPHRKTIHSSGILIPEKTIHHFGATFLPPKGFPTTHFDMYAAEDAGLYKFDILGQRGLGKIKDAISLIKRNKPDAPEIDIHNPRPFYRDEKIKALLREGKTMACFYVESPAMRGLLKKLRADTYRGLVAASSIIRPGVAKSGMMAEYIRRFREPETRQYIHPKLKEILAETYGVMVYQEDVLKVAHYFAGLTLEESDILRRGMSWKFKERNRFHEIKEKFFDNCAAYGYDLSVAREVWRQIESFGNFAFAKGHSASYAVESYQSLFLKAYYPLEYMVATINNGGGFYSVETYLNEARLHGGIVEAPCINRSEVENVLAGNHIFLGFGLMKDLREDTVGEILRERARHGAFLSLANFLDRVSISLEQLVMLIRTGAFRSLNTKKKELLWEAHFLLAGAGRSKPVADLFRTRPPRFQLPELDAAAHEDALDEIELLGFPLCSPFDLVPQMPANLIMARQLADHVGLEVRMCGYLIHVKNLTTRSQRPQHMQFGCFLDQEGNFIDTVHFPAVAARYHFQGRGIYLLKGVVVVDYDFISLEIKYMERLPYIAFQEM